MFKIFKTFVFLAFLSTSFQVVYGQAGAAKLKDHLSENHKQYHLDKNDFREVVLTSSHVSSTSGWTHFYYQQYHHDIPIRTGVASMHFDQSEEVQKVNMAFVPAIEEKIKSRTPFIDTREALIKTAEILDLAFTEKDLQFLPDSDLKTDSRKDGSHRDYYTSKNISLMVIPVTLVYESISDGSLILSWEVTVHPPHSTDIWSIRIDAETGAEVSRSNATHYCNFNHQGDTKNTERPSCSAKNALSKPTKPQNSSTSFTGKYNIFAPPTEAAHTDNRTLESGSNLINPIASLHGWHDVDGNESTIEYNYTRGNNVFAYYAPPGAGITPPAMNILREPGGAYISGNVPIPTTPLLFDYNNNLSTINGTDFLEDAIVNVFAWNNICHDVLYLYGFDEAAGNFQEINHSGSGIGTDAVRARTQDGTGLNNASFSVLPEGGLADQNAIMRMYLWNQALPNTILDSDFDNLVIAHEYAHGLSHRLVGGAANTSCLNNSEQGGEGWSDFFGMLLTSSDQDGDLLLEADVLGEGIRSVGSYLINEAPYGEGIRPAYYTINMDCTTANCNDYTYGDIETLAVPHGVGFLWATMLWEMTWELIDLYGYNNNIYVSNGTEGNIRALNIVVEALKSTPCSPSFIDMRDAIFTANNALYGGDGQDEIWAAFARRGLGFSASAGGNEAFDSPTMLVTKTVDKIEAEVGDGLLYTIKVKNNSDANLTNVIVTDQVASNIIINAISDGGTAAGNSISYPGVTIPVGTEITRTFNGTINVGDLTTILYDEPIEVIVPLNFVPAGAWLTDCDNPNPNSGSSRCWWHLNPNIASDGSLIVNLTLDGTKNNHLSFWQWFDVEATVDGGVIEIFNGGNWEDLDEKLIQNGYNSIIHAALNTPIGLPIDLTPLSGRRAYSGYSGGYINTILDLSNYSGAQQLRFRFASNTNDNVNGVVCSTDGPGSSTACEGWYLDDFKIFDLSSILNEACATSDEGFFECGNVGTVGTVVYEVGSLPVELLSFGARAQEKDILLNWKTATEVNNRGFEVQRKKEGATNFEVIAWVDGKGNTELTQQYTYIDADVVPNVTYYYKLRQIDFDNRAEFSNIAQAKINLKEDKVILLPNPTSGELMVYFGKDLDTNVEIEIFTMDGRKLRTYEVRAGESELALDLSWIPANICFVAVNNGTSRVVNKVLIY